MLMLLSPSKKLNFEQETPTNQSVPCFEQETTHLVEQLAAYSTLQIKELMKLSDKLSQLNHERYQNFDEAQGSQAFFAFTGDTYKNIPKHSYDDQAFEYAQEHLRILSGLYGALRPLDWIKPYRLEMGTKLKTDKGSNLYDYWGTTITEHIQVCIEQNKSQHIVNLASNEYAKVVDFKALNMPVVTPVFKDEKNGTYKTIAFYAKSARGQMAHYLLKHQIKTLEDLYTFHASGYAYAEKQGDALNPVFLRKEQDR